MDQPSITARDLRSAILWIAAMFCASRAALLLTRTWRCEAPSIFRRWA
jgi:hypothetical protein